MALPIPTEKTKIIALAELKRGADPTAVRKELCIPSAAWRLWMQEEDFRLAREEVLALMQDDIKTSLQEYSTTMTTAAMKSVLEGIKDDPKVALAWLEKTGALRTQGQVSGHEVTENTGLVININTSPPEPIQKIIQAETVD